MFYYFFLQYKNEIHFRNRTKLKIKEVAMIGILLGSTLMLSICAMLQIYEIYVLMILLLLIVNLIYIILYQKNMEKEGISEKVQNYKDTKIDSLIQLIQSDTYQLYSLEGLNWLIDCCKIETNKTALKISGQGIILPFITLAYGVIISNLLFNDILIVTLTFLSIMVIAFVLGKMVQPTIDDIVYPDKMKYERLKKDLEYIKTQLN